MTTKEDCLDALRKAAEQLGESPTKQQYEDLRLTPSASTILRHCGGWNAAKKEAGLHTNTSTGSRTLPKPEDVELPDGLVWEELSQDQRWHYRHKDESSRRSIEWKRHLRQWVFSVKSEIGGCIRCGESAPGCLDFHHRDPDDKLRAVNELVLFGYSKNVIRAEIEKCELLCANCHSREHTSVPSPLIPSETRSGSIDPADDSWSADELLTPGYAGLTKAERLRTWTHLYKAERGCERCSTTDPLCLQFHHHNDDKDDGVGVMIGRSAPTTDVLEEVGKCTVLCANCHRREHRYDRLQG